MGALWLRGRLQARRRSPREPVTAFASPVGVDSVDILPDSWAKRSYDVAISILLLVLLSLPMMLLALGIRLESAGPVLYRSRRVGRGGREFEMLKFRKMHRDASGPPLTSRNDDRLTRIGKFLLRTKLDELPQLWNVVRGDMSLVGPRPEDPSFVAIYPVEFRAIFRVKPGITGLSQLAFAKENRILARPEFADSYPNRLLPAKIEIDRLYIARRSIMLDTRVLIWTIGTILFGRDVAVDRGNGRLSMRRRPESPPSVVGERTT